MGLDELKKRQILLSIDEMPRRWYNIIPDLPEKMPPPKDPEKGPSRLENLQKILISECLKQEMSEERWTDIPEEVLGLFVRAGRPRPLYRAKALEEALGTPAKMYYKAEFYSPTGSHKVNTALAQAYYAKKEGYTRLTTETGAGQWGTALSYAAALVGLKCTVYWVRSVYNWKKDRLALMKMFGAEVFASPSDKTDAGRRLYKTDSKHPGSLAIAISEGIEDALNHDDSIYALGSVLNHVLMHQTIIGLETQKQFQKVGEYPDVVISCLGGGSNFGGIAIPFFGDVLRKEAPKAVKFIAAQTQSTPNLQGEYKYDFADHAEMTPMLKMFTLGHQIQPPPIRGDGLRYHAAAPVLSVLRKHGLIDTVAYPIDEKYVFEKAQLFTRVEGYIPATESAYSVSCAIDEAMKCKKTGEKKVILFNISGHGFLDLVGYREVLGIE